MQFVYIASKSILSTAFFVIKLAVPTPITLGRLFITVDLPAANALVIARFIENETQDILRRIAEKQADLMGEFSVRPQTLDQVDHTPVGIFRRITILQEQSPGTVICQITLQRIGPVDIDKGTAFLNSQRQGTDPLGDQLPVQAA